MFPEALNLAEQFPDLATAGQIDLGTSPMSVGLPTSALFNPIPAATVAVDVAVVQDSQPSGDETTQAFFPVAQLDHLFSSDPETSRWDTDAIRRLRAIQPGAKLDRVPNIFSILPAGFDLTTVEILTFFSGLMKDPYFIYRAVSCGWDARVMIYVVNHHRSDIQYGKNAGDVMTAAAMNHVLGMDAWLKKKYDVAVPVKDRVKFEDYTSAGLLVPQKRRRYIVTGFFLSSLGICKRFRKDRTQA